jgi:hypothetical protein
VVPDEKRPQSVHIQSTVITETRKSARTHAPGVILAHVFLLGEGLDAVSKLNRLLLLGLHRFHRFVQLKSRVGCPVEVPFGAQTDFGGVNEQIRSHKLPAANSNKKTREALGAQCQHMQSALRSTRKGNERMREGVTHKQYSRGFQSMPMKLALPPKTESVFGMTQPVHMRPHEHLSGSQFTCVGLWGACCCA